MTTPVQLYVYDLSNGLARQLSLQMTGKQIDGIWHTSVVVFGQEIFYGQGIDTTAPGKSHHGAPMQIIDMGETSLDEETFQQYLADISEHYTADKYHLLDFNCNSFTNDCVGFLTGGSIPSWIKDLPQDFLSTPFGAALRPTIDNMFRRPNAPATLPPANSSASNPELTSSLLQAIASQAASRTAYPTPAPTPPQAGPSTLTSPIQITTNPASLASLLSSHRCVSVFFTSPTCAPCRMVEPAFEDLAHNKASAGVAFAKVDMAVGMGGQVAAQWSVRATPTFLFFLDGKKMHELKGADVPELRTQVDLLIYQAFPPHPHATRTFSAIRAVSLQPILFSQVPAWDAALGKLVTYIDAVENASDFKQTDVKNILTTKVVPFLRTRFPSASPPNSNASSAAESLLTQWSSATISLSKALPPPEIFPIVDFWRLGLLDKSVSSWAAAAVARAPGTDVIQILLSKAIRAMDTLIPSPRNLILTTLRMLTNGFANPTLARHLLDPSSPAPGLSPRQNLTALLVPSLLHADAAVRTAAASLAFNVSAHYQRPLIEMQRSGKRGEPVADNDESGGQGDWEVEIVSAVVEALDREKQSEDVVHRLTASLALFLHLSPYWTQLSSFVEVLQVKDILRAKLNPGGCGEKGVQKKDARKLLEDLIAMCS